MPVLKIKFEIKLKEQINCLHKTGKILLKIKTMVWRKKAKMGNVKRIPYKKVGIFAIKG